MRQNLREKFNSIYFEGLEHSLCGDALYYVEYEKKGIKTVAASLLRIITSVFTKKCYMQVDKESKILFLFSNAYRNRTDLRRWFDEICGLVEHKGVVTPGKYIFTLANLKKIKFVGAWFRSTRKIGMESGERIYYLSKLLSAASDVWYIQDCIRKHQLDIRLFVSTCDVHVVDSLATQYFISKNITTASIQHGVISRKNNEWTITGSKSKYYLIYGEFTKQQAIKAGVSEEKLVCVGMPQYTQSAFVNEMQDNTIDEFGVLLDGFIENDLAKLKLADDFAKKNGLKYKVKLHPGNTKVQYGDSLNSELISEIYISEINVEQFGQKILFALLGKSVVFMEYALKLRPVFVYKESDEDDIFEGIDWCKVTSLEDMLTLYDELKNNKDVFEKKLKDTRTYLCECDIAKNYKEFFEKHSK